MDTVNSIKILEKVAKQRRTACWRCLICSVLLLTWLSPESATARADSSDGAFSVQIIEPYPTSNLLSSDVLTLDENQILDLAYRGNTQAELAQALARPSTSSGHLSEAERKRETVICLLGNATSQKLCLERAAAALKAHYGLAASFQAADLIRRTEEELLRQRTIQNKLMEAGVSIPDDLLISRLENETRDAKLKTESDARVLRINLSGLIPNSVACSYVPSVNAELVPSDIDVCDYVQRAMECHFELVTLNRIANQLDSETTELGQEVLAMVAKVPNVASTKSSILRRMKFALHGKERIAEANKQKNWMRELTVDRRQEITRNIEIAYEKKKGAALRWSIEKEQLEVWSQRIQQLETLGTEQRGNIAELSGAKLAKLKQETRLIERSLEWYMADVELRQSMGERLRTP